MNPIVAAHLSQQTLENFRNADQVDLFDAFIWACENDDTSLWDFLKTTSLDPCRAHQLPLVVMIEHNSFKMAQATVGVLGEYILNAVEVFVWNRRHETTLWSDPATRSQWLNILLPCATFHALAREKDTDFDTLFYKYDTICYAALTLTPEELALIPWPLELSDALSPLLKHGLHWSFMIQEVFPSGDPVEKTAWILTRYPMSNEKELTSEEEVLSQAFLAKCFHSVKKIMELSSYRVSHTDLSRGLSKWGFEDCLRALDALGSCAISQQTANKVVRMVKNKETDLKFGFFDAEQVKLLLLALRPYLEKATPEDQKNFWAEYLESAPSKSIPWFKQNQKRLGFPNLKWENNPYLENLKGDMFKNGGGLRPNSVLHQKFIGATAFRDSSLYATDPKTLVKKSVFAGVVESGNLALIEKALKAGAEITLKQFASLTPKCAPASLVEMFNTHIEPRHTPDQIIKELNSCFDVILLSPNPERFFDPLVLEQLKQSAAKASGLAVACLRGNHLLWCEQVLQLGNCAAKDVWDELTSLAFPFSAEKMELVLRYLSPQWGWPSKHNALSLAVKRNNTPVVEWLLQHHPELVNCSAPVLQACRDKNDAALDRLLQYCVPHQNEGMREALLEAFRNLRKYKKDNEVLIKKLLQRLSAVPIINGLSTEEQEQLEEWFGEIQAQRIAQEVEIDPFVRAEKRKI